jgi:hypothetical protein
MAPHVGHENDAAALVDEIVRREDDLAVQPVIGHRRHRGPSTVVLLLVDDTRPLDVARAMDDPLCARKNEKEVTVERVDEKGW